MARSKKKPCPTCNKARTLAQFNVREREWCDVCEREFKRRDQGYKQYNFGKKIGKLISTDPGAKAVAQWCAAVIEEIGGIAQLPKLISEFLADAQEDHLRVKRGELSKKIRYAELAFSLVAGLRALEELASKEKRIKQVVSKPVGEMNKAELLETISEVAVPIIEDNPQVAVKCLERAGYKVKLEKVTG